MNRFQIRVLTPPETISGEGEAIAALMDAGLQWLHVRKPKLGLLETRDFLLSLPKAWLPKMILHDHHQLSEEFPIGGNHFNSRNPLGKGSGVRTKDAVQKSFSIHDFEELRGLTEEIDAVFFSPVFPSLSKKGRTPAYSLDAVRVCLADYKSKKEPRAKVLALGGIDDHNISTVAQMGFDGAAVLGALWNDFSRDRNIDSLLKRFGRIKTTLNTFSIRQSAEPEMVD